MQWTTHWQFQHANIDHNNVNREYNHALDDIAIDWNENTMYKTTWLGQEFEHSYVS